MEIYTAVEKWLSETLGLNIAVIGRTGIERIIRAALQRSGVKDTAAYLDLLATSPEEFESCLENLVVPETWFFRDGEPFVLLKQYLQGQWLPAHPAEKLRILSVPCSTGEEPYSIAITLREAGLLSRQFYLDAADISRKALAAAAKAVYGKGAFRQPLTAAQEAFFTGPATERQVREDVVQTVHWHRANLIDPCFLAGHPPYHIVFCRNVLIYLTEEARRLVLANIDRLLHPDGILFTGHAEIGLLQQQGFTAIRHVRAFACRRTRPAGEELPITPLPQAEARSGPECAFVSPGPPPAQVAPAATIPARVPPLPLLAAAAVDALYTEALALADRGLFSEAVALCRQYLREQRPQADVYCLLGLIHEAARRSEEAEECYLKALYLSPDHYETLIHLSLLCRQQGDDHKATLYRQRAAAAERRPNGAAGC